MYNPPAGRSWDSHLFAAESATNGYVVVAAVDRTGNSSVTAYLRKPQAAARVIHCAYCSPPSRATWTGGDYSCRRPQ